MHDTWMLQSGLETVTLEEVYIALNAGFGNNKKSVSDTTDVTFKASPQQNNLDLFLMQATMTINQNLLKLLRQFRLDRLHIATMTGTASPSQAYSTIYIRSRDLALRKLREFN